MNDPDRLRPCLTPISHLWLFLDAIRRARQVDPQGRTPLVIRAHPSVIDDVVAEARARLGPLVVDRPPQPGVLVRLEGVPLLPAKSCVYAHIVAANGERLEV